MSTVSPKARAAETHWRVKERLNAATLLEMDIKTGRTHQIRVHCASMHHPIVGDAVYAPRRLSSKKKSNDRFTALLQSANRHMLHASSIRFSHPAEKRTMFFESPVPHDMQTLIDALSLDSTC
jgi:23S rRNA pseudouridine1911/1915/1917 synthase